MMISHQFGVLAPCPSLRLTLSPSPDLDPRCPTPPPSTTGGALLPTLRRLLLELCAGALLETEVDPEPDAAGILSGMLCDGKGIGERARDVDMVYRLV